MIFNLHKSSLVYDDYFDKQKDPVSEYYLYIISLIKLVIERNVDVKIDIIFSFVENLIISNEYIVINFNFEPTLIKQHDIYETVIDIGNIKNDDGKCYCVNMDRHDELKLADIVIDYSIPNIHNIIESKLYDDYCKKIIYLSPSVYKFNNDNFSNDNRKINFLTTFTLPDKPRRSHITNKFISYRHPILNLKECFDKDELEIHFKNTKILINIHQDEQLMTFEELRALPALQCGIIVISEYSALTELIPYKDLIIWTSYENIVNKAIEVLKNYHYYHNLIFKNKSKLQDLIDNDYIEIEKKILELVK
jgi:hypothetical protein